MHVLGSRESLCLWAPDKIPLTRHAALVWWRNPCGLFFPKLVTRSFFRVDPSCCVDELDLPRMHLFWPTGPPVLSFNYAGMWTTLTVSELLHKLPDHCIWVVMPLAAVHIKYRWACHRQLLVFVTTSSMKYWSYVKIHWPKKGCGSSSGAASAVFVITVDKYVMENCGKSLEK